MSRRDRDAGGDRLGRSEGVRRQGRRGTTISCIGPDVGHRQRQGRRRSRSARPGDDKPRDRLGLSGRARRSRATTFDELAVNGEIAVFAQGRGRQRRRSSWSRRSTARPARRAARATRSGRPERRQPRAVRHRRLRRAAAAAVALALARIAPTLLRVVDARSRSGSARRSRCRCSRAAAAASKGAVVRDRRGLRRTSARRASCRSASTTRACARTTSRSAASVRTRTSRPAPDGTIWVSAYAQSHGDLVVAQATGGRIPDEAWEWVDGVPDGPVVVPDSKIRGGIADDGPDVGMYTSIAVAPDGTPMVTYFDRDHGVAQVRREGRRRVADPRSSTSAPARSTTRGGSVVGMYTSLTLRTDDGRPGVAYLAHVTDADRRARRGSLRVGADRAPDAAPATGRPGSSTPAPCRPPIRRTRTSIRCPRASACSSTRRATRRTRRRSSSTTIARTGDLKLSKFNASTGKFARRDRARRHRTASTPAGRRRSRSTRQGVVHVAYVSATDGRSQVHHRRGGRHARGRSTTATASSAPPSTACPKPEFHFVGDDAGLVLPAGRRGRSSSTRTRRRRSCCSRSAQPTARGRTSRSPARRRPVAGRVRLLRVGRAPARTDIVMSTLGDRPADRRELGRGVHAPDRHPVVDRAICAARDRPAPWSASMPGAFAASSTARRLHVAVARPPRGCTGATARADRRDAGSRRRRRPRGGIAVAVDADVGRAPCEVESAVAAAAQRPAHADEGEVRRPAGLGRRQARRGGAVVPRLVREARRAQGRRRRSASTVTAASRSSGGTRAPRPAKLKAGDDAAARAFFEAEFVPFVGGGQGRARPASSPATTCRRSTRRARRHGKFQIPILARPSGSRDDRSRQVRRRRARPPRVGPPRRKTATLVPYYTRAEIRKGALAARSSS